jgi:hypothetical protein
MTRFLATLLAVTFMLGSVMVVACIAGGPGPGMQGPALDYTLMGMKEQGVWYFPCCAPEYTKRIAPHYQTYGPPPPPYCGVPCAPVAPPMIRK